ncbi:MAG: hypothetical protein EP349_01295 [Alphaproteobacteria bacterium]|nr:MAG: hypothetical protein EP349_01295 [Alphaproteobacteria bacterium]
MPFTKKDSHIKSRFRRNLSYCFRKTVIMGLLAMGPIGCMSVSGNSSDSRPIPTQAPIPTARWAEEDLEFRNGCLDPLNGDSPDNEAEKRLMDILTNIEEKGGAAGKALIDFIREQKDLRFTLEDMAEGLHGYYDPELETVNLDKSNTDAELTATLIHELVHVYQNKSGAHNRTAIEKDIHYAMAMELTSEAGAEAIAVRIAHEMKQNGAAEIWDAYQANFPDYADMGVAYQDSYDEDIKTKSHEEAAQFATEMAYEQYFQAQWRLDYYNLKTMTQVIRLYAESDSTTAYTDRDQTDAEAQKMATLPGGISFSRHTDALDNDEIFGFGNNALILRFVADAFEAQRKGQNTETNAETLDKFGLFAGVDFKAAMSDILDEEKAPNIVVALVMQAQAQGIRDKLLARQAEKMMEKLHEEITLEPLIIRGTPAADDDTGHRHGPTPRRPPPQKSR